MRILLVHNYYQSQIPSGENLVFEAERKLLEKRGHEVIPFTRNSDELIRQGTRGKIKGALCTAWNPASASAIAKVSKIVKPDVIHVHNTFPLISPSIFHTSKHSTARVLTLHNYRLLCPAAIPMRAERVCTDCLDRRSVLPALRHGCYRNSLAATVPLAANIALHRALGTWQSKVDAFITLSEFQRNLMGKSGFPTEKLYVKPNFFESFPHVVPWKDRGDYVVFVGRLSQEKGVHRLPDAWSNWGNSAPILKVVGSGPLREALLDSSQRLPVCLTGQLPSHKTQEIIARAKLLILPSEWYETFGMVIAESFAFGTPVAVSNLGPLPSIVTHGKNGVVFEAGNPDSLLQVVRDAWETPGYLEKLGLGARAEFEDKYTEEANYRQLMAIYEAAMRRAHERRH